MLLVLLGDHFIFLSGSDKFQASSLHSVDSFIEMALTQEEENFSKLCKIVLTVIPENLRTYFKWQWNCMYPHNKWQDSAADGQFLIGLVPQQRLARVSYLKPILHAGDSNNWDPTALFFVLTNSAIGLTNQNERNELEKLRDIRNTCFHSNSASITSPDLLRKITDIQNAFRTLNLQSGLVDITTIQNAPIKTQFSMQLQVQLDQEKQLNDHYNKYLAGQLNAIEENVEGMSFSFFVFSNILTIKIMTFM